MASFSNHARTELVLEGSRSGWIQKRAWYDLMVAGTWIVLEDLSLVQFELHGGESPLS